ncbi:MAG TPA: rhomboid family intramembrane serine protease [Desulfatiglandales bacterium]|jgi:rhomboid protease GluP|nr:rhomboid family intramembrane serine protease [Desulfatiglandales bacterium]
MVEILFENLTRDRADTYGLVLSAYHLPHSIIRSGNGWEIWVDDAVRDRALDLILKYIEENPDLSIADDQETQVYKKTFSGIWVCLLLLACHIVANRSDDVEKIIREYGASAFDIMNGEIYRTVTSLMLHSDYPHLAGNIAGIGIFGTAVCSITGAGVGWLMILLSGILGNLANAALFRYGHISIGASTAVFGAVGILAAYQLCRKIKIADQRMKAWLPIAGGLALLSFLGTGLHSDLTAHLFGFVAGVCLGLIYALYLYRLVEKKHQIYCMAATIGTVALSWL